jgi:hypothetical protein
VTRIANDNDGYKPSNALVESLALFEKSRLKASSVYMFFFAIAHSGLGIINWVIRSSGSGC